MSQDTDYGLDAFDEELKPSKGFSNGLEDLPDGDYEFLITKTALAKVGAAPKTVFRMTLQVVGGEYDGTSGEKTVFLTTQQGVDIFAGELARLGFDTDKWNAKEGRKFSVEFPKIRESLAGLVFQGKKEQTKSKEGKTFLNIRVNRLVGRRPLPETTTGAEVQDPF